MRAAPALLLICLAAHAQTPPQSPDVQRLIDESRAESDQQHFSEAAKLAEQAVDLSRAASDKRGEAMSLTRLSNIYYYWRKLELAVETANSAASIAAESGDQQLSAAALGQAANGLRDQGKLEEARAAYERQLESIRSSGDRKAEALNLRMTAILYRQMGDESRATGLVTRSLAIARDLKDPSIEAPALYLLGVLEDEQKRYDSALQHFNAALQLPGLSAMLRGQILRGIGTAHCDLHHYDRCIEFDKQQLDTALASGDPYQIAWGWFNLSYPQTLSGDHAAAYQSELKALNYLHGAPHDPFEEWHFQAGVGRELQYLGREREAIAYYREAIAIVERLRQGLVPTEEGIAKAASSSFTKELFDDAINLQFTQDPAQAFQTFELARARAFLSILAESKIDLRQGLAPSERKREDDLFARIAAIQKDLWHTGLTDAARRQKNAELESAENDLESLRLEIRRSNPRLAAIQYPKPLGLGQVQKEVLKPGVTLIEYSLGPERSFVWAVSRDRVLSAVLPPGEEIEKLVNAFRKSLSAPVSGLTSIAAENETLRLSAQLYRRLLQPVEAILAGSQSLIVVPDGVLYYLPFEALTHSGSTGFLLERFPVSYAPSATSLAAVDAAPPADGKLLLAFGDPAYARQAPAGERGPDLAPLPYTREEVNGIASLFPPEQRTVYLGAAVREEAVKGESLDRYRYIHFATHGILDEQHPARSGLALSAAAGKEDGILQVNEIADLRLHADLVTLSACNTGLGELVSGEGMLGLVRAFLYAGASSVAVSLWNVNDAATAALMKDFYRGLSRGLQSDRALRRAKIELLHQDNAVWRHPHYWAAFELWLR